MEPEVYARMAAQEAEARVIRNLDDKYPFHGAERSAGSGAGRAVFPGSGRGFSGAGEKDFC